MSARTIKDLICVEHNHAWQLKETFASIWPDKGHIGNWFPSRMENVLPRGSSLAISTRKCAAKFGDYANSAEDEDLTVPIWKETRQLCARTSEQPI